MTGQENIRFNLKLIKLNKIFSYKEIAEIIGIKQKSMYNYLNGYFDLSQEKQDNAISLIYDCLGDMYECL